MNLKDLMLGDLVNIKLYRPDENLQPVEYLQPVRIEQIGGIVMVKNPGADKEPYQLLESTEIEPIPLTRDIMVANGIKYQWGIPWYQGGSDGEFELHYSNGEGFNLGEKAIDVKLPIRYVHELQHALRLCGINKEITL